MFEIDKALRQTPDWRNQASVSLLFAPFLHNALHRVCGTTAIQCSDGSFHSFYKWAFLLRSFEHY
jgi:hypothetical protein